MDQTMGLRKAHVHSNAGQAQISEAGASHDYCPQMTKIRLKFFLHTEPCGVSVALCMYEISFCGVKELG